MKHSQSKKKLNASTKPVSIKHHSIVKGIIQPKLKIGAPNDKYEQEADRVADQVMRMPAPVQSSSMNNAPISNINKIQRKCVGCAKEDELLQKKSSGITPEMTPAIHSNIQAMQSGGQALSKSDKNFFEPRFNTDFSQVRLHTNQQANNTAHSINAKAFTLGHHIAFDTGQYRPQTVEGKKLLAHELTHVIQQGSTQTIQREDRTILTLTEFYPLTGQINADSIGFHHLPRPAVDIALDYIRPDFKLGDQVKVLGKTPLNWLKVEREIKGEKQVGYVDWRYIDVIPKSQSIKDNALKTPWSADVVRELLQMSNAGQEVIRSLEKDVKVKTCKDILSYKLMITVKDPRANTLKAEELIKFIANNQMKIFSSNKEKTDKPSFIGFSNPSDKSIKIKRDLNNFDAAAVFRHEMMHIKSAIDGRPIGEKLIRKEVSIWRQGMEKVLGFSEKDKNSGKLPASTIPEDKIDETVARSQHYTPTKIQIGPDTYIITVFIPRPIDAKEFKKFKKP